MCVCVRAIVFENISAFVGFFGLSLLRLIIHNVRNVVNFNCDIFLIFFFSFSLFRHYHFSAWYFIAPTTTNNHTMSAMAMKMKWFRSLRMIRTLNLAADYLFLNDHVWPMNECKKDAQKIPYFVHVFFFFFICRERGFFLFFKFSFRDATSWMKLSRERESYIFGLRRLF